MVSRLSAVLINKTFWAEINLFKNDNTSKDNWKINLIISTYKNL